MSNVLFSIMPMIVNPDFNGTLLFNVDYLRNDIR